MYFQPYGDDQQLNLNWIINEIIELHKQLDPDYETPSFTQVYPYSNLNRLNLDWILSELKALKELAPEPAPPLDIQTVAEALVALPFDSTKSYQIFDFISRDDEIWRATEAIPAGGVWDESKWFKTKLGTDLAVLDRWINAINADLTTLQNTVEDLSSEDISDDSDAGGATVKASLNALKDSLNSLNNIIEWEQGGIYDETGLDSDIPTRVRTKGFLPPFFKLQINTNLRIRSIARYDDNNNFVEMLSFTDNTIIEQNRNNNPNGYKIRVILRAPNATDDITPEDVEVIKYEVLYNVIASLKGSINPKKIVLISDSYGENQTAGGKSWETVVEETLTDKTIVKYTRGSGAFGYQDTTNVRYFPKYINDNVTADDNVDMVLMLCGANDGNLVADGNTTQTYIQNGIAEAKTALLAKFPNVKKIAIGFCGNTSTQAKKRSYHIARMAYESGCADNGLIFAYNFHHVLSNPTLINTTDYVHPTLAGSKLLGEAAIDYILCESIDPFDYYALPVISTTLTPTYPDEGNITNNTCVKVGNTVSISARQTGLSKTGTYFIPFTIPDGYRPMANLLCPMILQIDSGKSFKIANARVLTNGNIDVQPLTNLPINEWVFSISYATSEI